MVETFPDAPGEKRSLPDAEAMAGLTDDDLLWVRCPCLAGITTKPIRARDHAFLRPFHKLNRKGSGPVGNVRYGLLKTRPNRGLRVLYSLAHLEAGKKRPSNRFLDGDLLVYADGGVVDARHTTLDEEIRSHHLHVQPKGNDGLSAWVSEPRASDESKKRKIPATPLGLDDAEAYHVGTLAVDRPDLLEVAGTVYMEAGKGITYDRAERMEKVCRAVEGDHPVHVVPQERSWMDDRHLQANFILSPTSLEDRDYPLLRLERERADKDSETPDPRLVRHDAIPLGGKLPHRRVLHPAGLDGERLLLGDEAEAPARRWHGVGESVTRYPNLP